MLFKGKQINKDAWKQKINPQNHYTRASLFIYTKSLQVGIVETRNQENVTKCIILFMIFQYL